MSYFPSTNQRKTVAIPPYNPPHSAPATPQSFGTQADMNPYQLPSSQHRSFDTSNRRHGYSNPSPVFGGLFPSTPSSPLALPPLLPGDNDDVESPDAQLVLTPVSANSPSADSVKVSSDHSVLSSLAQMPTPKFGNLGSDSLRQHFPLLSPHRPMRPKTTSILDQEDASPSSPPKEYPLYSISHFPFLAKSKIHTVTNPYSGSQPFCNTTIAYHLRIPRRFRPIVLIVFCLLTFGVVFLNNAMSNSSQVDSLLLQLNQISPRRFVGNEVLVGINDRGKQAAMSGTEIRSRLATAAVRSAPVKAPEMLEFANAHEELAALISFVTATHTNVLPPLDPTVPLDPSIVLDFDPSTAAARGDLDLLVTEIDTIYPVIVLGKMRDPWLREIRKMLAHYKITPAPLIIDVDQRRDQSIFFPLIARLLGTEDLPQVLLQGELIGSYHEILSLYNAGQLRSTFEASGAVAVRDAKKKKGVMERERMEMERILSPAPIIDVI